MLYGKPECYDQDYVHIYAPKIKRITHRWFRARVDGVEHLPEGPFVAAGNHGGGVMIPDALVWLSHYHTLKRKTRLLALSNPGIFDYYPKRIAAALSRLGAIKAHIRNAIQTLEQGHALQVYPGGDVDACRPFWKRNQIVFDGNIAYAKLANRAGVPIVPVVSLGGHNTLLVLWDGRPLCRLFKLDRRLHLKAFPLSLCLPWGVWLGPHPGYIPWPARIYIKVLPPITPKSDPEQTDRLVRKRMQQALTQMAQGKRT